MDLLQVSLLRPEAKVWAKSALLEIDLLIAMQEI